MKLLHITDSDILVDSRILKEIDAAKRSGFDVYGIGVKRFEDNKVNQNSGLISISLECHKLKKIFVFRYIRYFFTLLEIFVRFTIFGLKVKPKIIHCNDVFVLPVGALLSFLCGSKLIYDAHELESDKNGIPKVVGKLILLVEKLLWSSVDGLVVVSPSIDNWYLKNIGFKESVVVLNSPIINQHSKETAGDAEYLRRKYRIPCDALIFVYIGMLVNGRGVEVITQAFNKSNASSYLVFLGAGNLEGYIKDQVNYNKNIFIHEVVLHNEVVSIAKSADVGLCLIENVSLSDYYCLPNKLFEYLFAGLPVISSKLPDVQALLEENKCGVVTENDPESLNSIIKRFEEGAIRIEFSIDSLEKYTWSVQAEKLIGLYKSVMK